MKYAFLMTASWALISTTAQAQAFDLFRVIDANSDQQITREETTLNAQTYFDKIDQDKDGLMTIDELKLRAAEVEEIRGGAPDKLAQKIEADATRQFLAIDVNGDGQLTRDEYINRALSRHQATDLNADGLITRDEFKARRQSIAEKKRAQAQAARDLGIKDQQDPQTNGQTPNPDLKAQNQGANAPTPVSSVPPAVQ
jgi:Ca2+-binding EF-hand superfamily protein